MSTITRGPARFSARLAPGMAFVATISATIGWFLAVVPAFLGTLVLAYGSLSGRRRFVHIGAALTFFGVMLGGWGAENVMLPMLGAVLTITAWDAGLNGDIIGRQMGSNVATRRAEAYHSAATFGLGLLGAGVAYGVFTYAWSGQPMVSLILLVIALLLYMIALRE